MVIITLPPELEKALAEQAEQTGTTPELLALDVLQKQFLGPHLDKPLPQGATMADAFADYIGSISTRETAPEGSSLSENTGRRFAQLMVEKRKQGKL